MIASDNTNAAPTKSSPVPPDAGPPQRYTRPAICVPTRSVDMGLWRCPASGFSPAASARPCLRRTRGRGCPSKLWVDQHRLLGPVTVGVFPLLGPEWRASSAATRQRDTRRTTDQYPGAHADQRVCNCAPGGQRHGFWDGSIQQRGAPIADVSTSPSPNRHTVPMQT